MSNYYWAFLQPETWINVTIKLKGPRFQSQVNTESWSREPATPQTDKFIHMQNQCEFRKKRKTKDVKAMLFLNTKHAYSNSFFKSSYINPVRIYSHIRIY